MTAAQQALWERVQRHAARLTPAMQKAVLKTLHAAIESMPLARLEGMLATGAVGPLVDEALKGNVFAPVRDELRRALVTETQAAAHFLPGALATIRGGFNILNPNIVTAVRDMEARVFETLREQIAGATRATIEVGLTKGVGPRTMARELRGNVAMAPHQIRATESFEKALRERNLANLLPHKNRVTGEMVGGRQLRDRRFDATLRKAFGPDGKGLTEDQITRMVNRYTERMEAFNTETIARTTSLEAVKQGQRLSWLDAIERGAVDETHLVQTWTGVMDNRERDEHRALEGETVPFMETFSTGDIVPGMSDFNCRCTAYIHWVEDVEMARRAGIGLDAVDERLLSEEQKRKKTERAAKRRAARKAGTMPPKAPKIPKPAPPPATPPPRSLPPPTSKETTPHEAPIRQPGWTPPTFYTPEGAAHYLQEMYTTGESLPHAYVGPSDYHTATKWAMDDLLKWRNAQDVFAEIARGFDVTLGEYGMRLDGLGIGSSGKHRAIAWATWRDGGYLSGGTRRHSITFQTDWIKSEAQRMSGIVRTPFTLENNVRWLTDRRMERASLLESKALKAQRAPRAAALRKEARLLRAATRFTSSTDSLHEVFSTAAHEAGHVIMNKLYLESRWLREIDKIDRIEWARVSEYALKNHKELWAETTALIAEGRFADIPAEVLAAYERTLRGALAKEDLPRWLQARDAPKAVVSPSSPLSALPATSATERAVAEILERTLSPDQRLAKAERARLRREAAKKQRPRTIRLPRTPPPLTPEDRAVLKAWMERGTTVSRRPGMGAEIRKGQMSSTTKGVVRDLDRLMELNRFREDVDLYRGTAGWDVRDLKVGQFIRDKSYLSTSSAMRVAKEFAKVSTWSTTRMDLRTIWRVHAPRGTLGIQMPSHMGFAEREWLLGRNLRYRVDKVSFINDPWNRGRQIRVIDITAVAE